MNAIARHLTRITAITAVMAAGVLAHPSNAVNAAMPVVQLAPLVTAFKSLHPAPEPRLLAPPDDHSAPLPSAGRG